MNGNTVEGNSENEADPPGNANTASQYRNIFESLAGEDAMVK